MIVIPVLLVFWLRLAGVKKNMKRFVWMTKLTRLFFTLVTLLLAEARPVSAQMEPKATYPIAGSTVTSEIELIRVEFNKPIDPTMSGLELRRGDNQVWIAGVGAGFCDAFSCQLHLGQLEPDLYTVAFDVFTPSGEVIRDNFKFTVLGESAPVN